MKQNGSAQTIEQFLDMNDPNKFYSYGGGGKMTDEEIKGHIIELMYKVRERGVSTHVSISCGDTRVSVFYDAVEEHARISIDKDRKEANIFYKEEGIVDTGRIPLHMDPNSKIWKLNHKETWDA